MLKRSLFFSSPMRLSLKDNQLVFYVKETSDEKRTVPIEDIGYVILEHQMISISLPLLNALAENNVAVIICNGSAMPNAMVQPLNGNNIQGEVYRMQTEAPIPLKKNLWKQCVEAKIKNQSRLLDKLGLDSGR